MATVLALVVIRLVHALTDMPTRMMTSDPTAVLEGPFYAGFAAVLGYAAWICSAVVLLLAASLLGAAQHSRRSMFRALGALSLLLFVDDAFLLHEVVVPHYLGVPELGVYALYAAAVLAVALRHGRAVWNDRHRTVLLASIAFLGVSVLADQIGPLFPSWHFMEAAAQLQGILLWFAFAVGSTRTALRSGVAHDPTPPADRLGVERPRAVQLVG